MSSSTANHFKLYYPIIAEGTADFCEKLDQFFDIMNVRSTGETISKGKPFLQGFRSPNDKRLKWFVNEFLPYFLKWKISISERNVPYNEHDRSRMFISYQTYEGLQITVYSYIETVKFLLSQGMEFVLTKRFNPDVAEEYFGRQRQLGRTNDNPNIYQFGFNVNTIRIQRSVVPITGNTRGAHKNKRKHSWEVVDDTPLRKK